MAKVEPITISTSDVTGIANIREIVDDINQSINQLQKVGNEWIAEILKEIGQAYYRSPFGKPTAPSNDKNPSKPCP